jgi:NADH:ubiquinone oxidoreductase subunit
MSLFHSLFTWWQEPTWGTRFDTWRRGEPVGADKQGNRYFRERGGDRRWVLYSGEVEASRVPPEWNAWLQHTVDEAPAGDIARRPWEREHIPNTTGTPDAYHPPGSLIEGGERDPATGDYEPWRPS